MSQISVTNLTFAYDGSYDNVFENTSFQLDTDWKVGFIGRNGRGKTTFLRLLLGEYKYLGTISASVEFEYFPYTPKNENADALSVIKNECPAKEWEIQREIALLEVEPDALYRPFSTLSQGERTKILLAALFLRENSFLLIDEPTNHLDENARSAVARYLRGKKGFILVSHDRTLLDACTDHTISINRSTIEVQSGNFSSYWQNKERRDAFELAENDKLKREIGRLSDAKQRNAKWADKAESEKIGIHDSRTEKSMGRRVTEGARSKKLMARASALDKRVTRAIDDKSKLLKDLEYADSLKLHPLDYFSERLLSLNDVSIFYGEKCAAKNVSFELMRGDRIALVGKNGCGKSSVIKLLLGEKLDYTGELRVGSRLKISYVPQSTEHLFGKLSDFARSQGIDESLFKTILRKLDFSRVQFDKDLSSLSEGQKKKVLIAKSLSEEAHLYVFDEPLNFIDVMSRIQIEELLLEFRPTLLFVEHDSVFRDKIATKTVNM